MNIWCVVCGFVMDLILGDPPWLVSRLSHPVIWVGKTIKVTEKVLKKVVPNRKIPMILSGFLLLFLNVYFWVLFYYFVREVASFFSPVCLFFVESWICYRLFATKSLEMESKKVYFALQQRDTAKARKELSYLVGRETSHLEEEKMIKATVETIAENATDGVVAPLFYGCFFGITGLVCYKVVNTLDSMVGYRNETYENLGKVSARCDDILNIIPSRLAAIIMIIVSFFDEFSTKRSVTTFFRDRYAHKSPNSAQTESVVAGGLGIQLGGNSVYFGKIVEKPTIGEATRPAEIEDISRTNRWMKTTAWVAMSSFAVLAFLGKVRGYL